MNPKYTQEQHHKMRAKAKSKIMAEDARMKSGSEDGSLLMSSKTRHQKADAAVASIAKMRAKAKEEEKKRRNRKRQNVLVMMDPARIPTTSRSDRIRRSRGGVNLKI